MEGLDKMIQFLCTASRILAKNQSDCVKTSSNMATTIHLGKSLNDEAIMSAINKAASSLEYLSFRQKQMEALQQFVRGHDVFVSLPI